MNTSNKEYLKKLSFDSLLDLFEDAIKHEHYCPIECKCFKIWDGHKFTSNEVRCEIKELVNRSIST